MSPKLWRRIAFASFVALIALHLGWHLRFAPPNVFPLPFVLAIALGPLLLAAIAMLFDFRRGLFWAGFVALGYFSHGVMEAWTSPSIRLLAHAEWLLATILVVAVGAAGLAERRTARGGARAA